jgi:DNA-binding GntR family transcriptional regulator
MQSYMTMTELASWTLRNDILRGKYPPGARLVPTELSAETGLGISAIREAIRELAGSGLVNTVANKGTRIADPPTMEEIVEIYKLRCQVEGTVAQRGAKHLSKTDVEQMEKLNRMMGKKNLPVSDHFMLNREFHMLLYKRSGWSQLCNVITQLFDQVLVFRTIVFRDISGVDFGPVNEDHRKIISSIRKGEPAKVKELVIANLKNGLESTKKYCHI